jgi:hypothetical protein
VGAAVFLDGVDTGSVTPFVITDVSAGSHTIKLTRYHYKDEVGTVTVTAGATTSINWALTYASTQMVELQPNPTDGKDAYVYEAASGSNYGSSSILFAGASTAGARLRSYLQFDLIGIPSTAVVTNADLGLYYFFTSGAVATPIGAYRVTGTWTEGGITWNNQPTSAATQVYTRTVPASATNAFLYWDIDSLVQGWIDGSIPNQGVMLRDIDEGTVEAYKDFRSSDYATDITKRPKLVIYYYDPAP